MATPTPGPANINPVHRLRAGCLALPGALEKEALLHPDVEWEEVRALVQESHRLVAPRQLDTGA